MSDRKKTVNKLRFQIANDTVFRAYDYGSPEENQKVYGQEYPPVYSLDKVTVPLSAYYAQNDWLVVPQVGNAQCPLKGFRGMQFAKWLTTFFLEFSLT